MLGGLWSLQWRGDVVVRSMGFKLLHLSSRSKAWWMIQRLMLLSLMALILLLVKGILLLHRECLAFEWVGSQLGASSICTSCFGALDIVLMQDLATTHDRWLLGWLSSLLLFAPRLR